MGEGLGYIHITQSNKIALREAFKRAGRELSVPEIDTAPLDFRAIAPRRYIDEPLTRRAAIQIDTNNPNIMGWLEIYSGKLTIVNLANQDKDKNFKESNFIKDTLESKYTGTGIKFMEEGTSINEVGAPQYYWLRYTNGKNEYSFAGVNLARDIKLENQVGFFKDRPFPQVPVSKDVIGEALQTLADSGVKGVRLGGTNCFKFDGETTVSIHALGSQNKVYNITIRGKGDYRIYESEDGGEIYEHILTGKMNIGDMKKYAPNAKSMEQSAEKQKEYGDYNKKYTLDNPSPLQSLIMWTEVEAKHKAALAKDPHSIKKFTSYICPAGEPTCGFGSTGSEFKKEMTVDEAYAAMNKHIAYQRASIRNQIGEKDFDKLKLREQDALVSLGYNAGQLGEGLVKLVKEYAANPTNKNEEAVTDKMMEYCKYRKVKGGPLIDSDGLKNRRFLEVALFTGDIDNIKSHQFKNLGAPEKEMRQQWGSYTSGIGSTVLSANEHNHKKVDKSSAQIGEELKQQGVQQGGSGYLPQEVMDKALAQVQAQARSSNLS